MKIQKPKKVRKVLIHSKTRLIGKPYICSTIGYGSDCLMVIRQKFETTGYPGPRWVEIGNLIRDYVLECLGDEIKQVTGMEIEKLDLSVFYAASPAKVLVKPVKYHLDNTGHAVEIPPS